MREIEADALVVGGGLGGVAAALAAADAGRTVVLTEETDWLGGQLTSQGVPPDEHPWIEQFGCTARYRRLRDELGAYYRRWYPLGEAVRSDLYLNPGRGRASQRGTAPRPCRASASGRVGRRRSGGGGGGGGPRRRAGHGGRVVRARRHRDRRAAAAGQRRARHRCGVADADR